ncbi:MAG: mechanosensitive ion channel family protein [Oscillospiraceae bacterium]|nr:mechanosensitive ion channel family protein [Oscillospiraceae bacterium]
METITNFWDKYLGFGNISLNDLLFALIVFVICLIIIRIVMHIARRAFKKSKMDPRMQKFVLGGIRLLLLFLAILIAADKLGIPVTSLVALLSVASLAISLAIQGMLSNLAGGIVILTAHPFNIGDYIEASSVAGTVYEIDLIYTKLDTPDGQRVLVPNSDLSSSKITNYSTLGKRRLSITVGASYDASASDVKAAMLAAVTLTGKILDDPTPIVFVDEYKDSCINYTLLCWTLFADYWDTRYALTENVKTAFDNNGIEMTYNHLNVHIVQKQ